MNRKLVVPNIRAPRLRLIVLGLGVLIVFLVIKSSATSVDSGDRAVVTGFGGSIDSVAGPGFHIAPFKSFHPYKCGLEQTVMSKDPDDGEVRGDDSVKGASKEGSDIAFDLTISYHLDCATSSSLTALYTNRLRSSDQIKFQLVRPAVRSIMSNTVAKFGALDAATDKRSAIAAALSQGLRDRFKGKPGNGAIVLDSVDMRKVYLPDNIQSQVNEAIGAQANANKVKIDREAAQNKAETERLVATQTAETQKITASGIAAKDKIDAESAAAVKKIAAAAAADEVRLKGSAEAEANAAVAKSLTPELVDLKKSIANAEALGKAGTVIVGGSGSGSGSAPNIILDGRNK